ncbi:MAG: hypothetical protein ACR2JV_05585 [Gaiellales bacterium]
MSFSVEYEAEGGLHVIHLSAGRPVRGEEIRDREGVVCGVVLVDERGQAIDVEILSLPHFDLDACAAAYGFSDRAGAIGMALATAAA